MLDYLKLLGSLFLFCLLLFRRQKRKRLIDGKKTKIRLKSFAKIWVLVYA